MKYPYIAPALQRQSFFIVTNEDVPQLSVSQLDSKIPWPSLDRLQVGFASTIQNQTTFIRLSAHLRYRPSTATEREGHRARR